MTPSHSAPFQRRALSQGSLSWIVSEEDSPAGLGLNRLRLRSAYGRSGVRPGTNDALQFFQAGVTATARLLSGDTPGLVVQAPGNPGLKPETTTEVEAGLDWEMFSNRVSFEFTYYNKKSRDALIARVLPRRPARRHDALREPRAVTHRGVEACSTPISTRIVRGGPRSLPGYVHHQQAGRLAVSRRRSPRRSQQEGYPLNGYWQSK